MVVDVDRGHCRWHTLAVDLWVIKALAAPGGLCPQSVIEVIVVVDVDRGR